MNNLETVIYMLPVVFMFHDFEKIIFMKSWLSQNEQYMHDRFPKIAGRLVPHLKKVPTSGFALGVAIMFCIVSAATFISVATSFYQLWLSAFMAFSLHLLVHIGQWIVFRRYVPAVVTSFIALPYSIYGFRAIVASGMFSASEIAVWSIIGLAAVAISLPAAHLAMSRIKL